MSGDRQLIDQIKDHFARKSSALLRLIAQAGENERWSAEAITAADEVLLDRAAGCAEEPTEVEEETAPVPSGHTVDSLAAIAGLNFLTFPLGFVVLPANRPQRDDPIARDLPVPFGPGVAWLAVETVNTAQVAAAIGMREARQATWEEGIESAYRSSVFVTPPVGDWTLVVSGTLFPPHRAGEFVKALVERLSGQFGDTQYFCTHEGVGLHGWARARDGRLVRGFAWLGQGERTLWDEGVSSDEERTLGLSPSVESSGAAGEVPETGLMPPDEGSVLQLAANWSVDPTTLDEHFKEPVMGFLGHGPWAVADPIAAADPARRLGFRDA